MHRTAPHIVPMSHTNPKNVTRARVGMADRRHPEVGDRFCSSEDFTASVWARKTNAAQQSWLPAPLTQAVLCEAQKELSQGACGALEQCVACYNTQRMSASDLLSCVQMMAPLSKTFAALFRKPAKLSALAPSTMLDVVEEEVSDDMPGLFVLSRAPTDLAEECGDEASPDDMAILMAISGVPIMPAPAQPTPWEREKSELLEHYKRLVLFDKLVDSKIQELQFERLIETKTQEQQKMMMLQDAKAAEDKAALFALS